MYSKVPLKFFSAGSDILKFYVLAPKLHCFLNENMQCLPSENPFLLKCWGWDIWALNQ